MLKGIFDTHAHYDDSRFDIDRDTLLTEIFNDNVSSIINCACDLSSCYTTLALAEKYKGMYAALGIHAHEAAEAREGDLDKIKELLSNKKAIAVGEIGLDYHYDFSPRDVQIELFRRQILLARELDLPVIVHDRDAHEDTMSILRELRPRGVVHCFSGSSEMAVEVVKLGLYIGIGGAVTFKNARKPIEVVENVPIERILLETDAPYMTPVPHRGERCDSSHIAFTAQKIAEIKGITPEEVVDICRENAQRLFRINE